MGLALRHVFEEETGPRLVPPEPFVLSHRPGDQRFVDVPVERIKRRGIKLAVIGDPAPQNGVEPPRDIPQAQIRAIGPLSFSRHAKNYRSPSEAPRARNPAGRFYAR